jgi:hypothetical protein
MLDRQARKHANSQLSEHVLNKGEHLRVRLRREIAQLAYCWKRLLLQALRNTQHVQVQHILGYSQNNYTFAQFGNIVSDTSIHAQGSVVASIQSYLLALIFSVHVSTRSQAWRE